MALCHKLRRTTRYRAVQVDREITVTHFSKPLAHHDWKRIIVRDNGHVSLCTEVHARVDVTRVIHEFDKLRKPCETCGR